MKQYKSAAWCFGELVLLMLLLHLLLLLLGTPSRRIIPDLSMNQESQILPVELQINWMKIHSENIGEIVVCFASIYSMLFYSFIALFAIHFLL